MEFSTSFLSGRAVSGGANTRVQSWAYCDVSHESACWSSGVTKQCMLGKGSMFQNANAISSETNMSENMSMFVRAVTLDM